MKYSLQEALRELRNIENNLNEDFSKANNKYKNDLIKLFSTKGVDLTYWSQRGDQYWQNTTNNRRVVTSYIETIIPEGYYCSSQGGYDSIYYVFMPIKLMELSKQHKFEFNKKTIYAFALEFNFRKWEVRIRPLDNERTYWGNWNTWIDLDSMPTTNLPSPLKISGNEKDVINLLTTFNKDSMKKMLDDWYSKFNYEQFDVNWQNLTLNDLNNLADNYTEFYFSDSKTFPALKDFKLMNNFDNIIKNYNPSNPQSQLSAIVNLGGKRKYFMKDDIPYIWFQPDEVVDMTV